MLKLIFVLLASTALAAAQLVIPGGKTKIDPNDELLVAALAQVEPQINHALSSSEHYRKIGRVLEAEVQIVDGLKYMVAFQLGTSACLKTDTHLELCKLNGALPVQTCHATIFSQPWNHKTELTSFHCDAAHAANQKFVGGIFPVDNEDEHLKKALFSVEHTLSDRFNSPYVSQVVKVLEAKAQVVAGLKYFITFKLGQTYRLKDKKYEEPNRRSEVVRNLVTCHVTLWMKPAVEVADVLDFKCDN